MIPVARHTDPATSHEATDGIDLARSQMIVLTFAKTYLSDYFTDKGLVATYRTVTDTREDGAWPPLSDSRIRTARLELATARLVHFAGHTKGTARRERIWTLDPALAEWKATPEGDTP